MPPEQERLTIHGAQWAFVRAGEPEDGRRDGSALLLLHGIGASLHTWDRVFDPLAERHRVVAPDLLGHGDSDKPRSDYSPAAFANSIRDLLAVLDIARVTIVGHSFGGGVAMQFAYQFPEAVERIVLVSTGGLGREVTPLLRAATLPGAPAAIAWAEVPLFRGAVSRTARALARNSTDSVSNSVLDLLELYEGLSTPAARRAFQATLRTTMGRRGQSLSMLDRAYLAATFPTLLVWGARDYVLPVRHAYAGHDAMPGSRLEVFEQSGHCPPRQQPERFVEVLEDFIATTEPASYDEETWRELLRSRARTV